MGNFKNLSNICLSSLSNIFLDDLEIAKVTSVFKAGNNTELNNYRPIFVLICFSKILERVIYNRLYKYRLDSNIIYKKHFGFYEGQSTNRDSTTFRPNTQQLWAKQLYFRGVYGHIQSVITTYYLKNQK